MKTMLVTGGTVFVSRYMAEYFVRRGWQVTVLNRNTRPQSDGVSLVEADRHALGDKLRSMHFDAVLDVTAYDAQDVNDLLDALVGFDDYVMISSSAVYPDTGVQPFSEASPTGENAVWGAYGTDKLAAEQALLTRVPQAYILRPPYIYGPMNNVYREAFVFDCAMDGRTFRLPGEGRMQLQFFHVEDLCRFTELLLETHPVQRVYNVGNPETVSVRQWAELCYRAAGKEFSAVSVPESVPVRKYFCFYPYEYCLNVAAQQALMPDLVPLEDGLRQSFAWYAAHRGEVRPKDYMRYIDEENL